MSPHDRTSTKQAFTAGPWTMELARVVPDAPVFGFVVKADGKVPFVASAGVSSPNHPLIIDPQFRQYVATGFTEEEVEANARLIAAAPELFAMVNELQEALNETTNMIHELRGGKYDQATRARLGEFEALDDRALDLMIQIEGKE